MELALFSQDGLLFLLRWGHFLAGITWIGLLYYFNFVQGPFFNETDAETKKGATQKLVPRALWWFRWAAMFTFLTGWTIISMRAHDGGMALLNASWGVAILSGGLLGTVMWANVWFVIWPNQQVVIAAAKGEKVAGDPAASGRRAFLASRTNTLLSISMLFFMGAASHLPVQVNNPMPYWVAFAVIVLAIELNALLSKKGPTTAPIETVRGVITSGTVLAVVFYVLFEVLTK